MAAHNLSVLSTPEFPQTFEDAVHYEIRRVAGIVRANYEQPYLCRYDWPGEWCDREDKATVHDLKSEQEFCAWHFRVVEARRNRESHDLVLPASRCRLRARASRHAQRLRAGQRGERA